MKRLDIYTPIKDKLLPNDDYTQEYIIEVLDMSNIYHTTFVSFSSANEGVVALNKKSALELSEWLKVLSEELKE